ncbi:response regulator [Photobacterium lutimaris]|uniref:Response regulator n=1 Tax=Photobacterium lutimaris TaxID=388278 RepID=A0A2T3J0Q0_9GAMM|nr:response regulator [Photobacterium lutimaris]PSU34659.1 response regulator [Photobacterium lutimaris]TDR71494.1 response regulator receiver domain-containing protein [Photobacterium lutimaris]
MNKFLIIEDNKMMAKIMAELLRKSVPIQKLHYAPSAQQAYNILLKNTVDCVFLDLSLSRPLDGIEVLQYIRAQYPSLSVVIVTGDSEIDTVKRVISLNPNDYLIKPLSMQKIQRCLEKLGVLQLSDD